MPKEKSVQHIHYNGRGMRVYNASVYHGQAGPVRRPGGNARRCYRCRQAGHLARNCDSPCVVPVSSSGASSSGQQQQLKQQQQQRQRQQQQPQRQQQQPQQQQQQPQQQQQQPQQQQQQPRQRGSRRRGRKKSSIVAPLPMAEVEESPVAASTPKAKIPSVVASGRWSVMVDE